MTANQPNELLEPIHLDIDIDSNENNCNDIVPAAVGGNPRDGWVEGSM